MFVKSLRSAALLGALLGAASLAHAQPATDPAFASLKTCLSGAVPANNEDYMKSINPALNDPDRVTWCLFLYVSSQAATQGNNNALFETWASDNETFQPNPVWPTTPPVMALRQPILPHLARAPQPGDVTPFVLPFKSQCDQNQQPPPCVGEETRRNKSTFDFIKNNKLFTRDGLRAYTKPIVFPADSIEVKANWVPVSQLADFLGQSGAPVDPSLYHLNTTTENGQQVQYALLSFHVISKMVPNWTWATFEHMNNPGRCDFIGCADSFGMTPPFTAPHSLRNPGKQYPNCTKTPALTALFATFNIDPKFANYCLKGSQTDFTDASGVPTRVGNSVTEGGFVATASCISCHGRSAYSFATGGFTMNRIFIYMGDTPIGNVGPLDPGQFVMFPQQDPVQGGNIPLFKSADFVWSLPLCALDASGTSRCANK
jgi:hypothetical protein